MTEVKISLACEIVKSVPSQNLVFGWLYICRKADGTPVVDHSGDVVDIETLEKAAYDFVLESRKAGVMHEKTEDGDDINVRGALVECIVFSAEKRAAMGLPEGSTPDGIWAGWKVDDDAMRRVEAGELKMFSFGGFAESHALPEG